MAEYVLRERTVRVDDSWDVIVVGGGPGGKLRLDVTERSGATTGGQVHADIHRQIGDFAGL